MCAEPTGRDLGPPRPAISENSRVLALDWGEKRVGIAISDPLGISAQGLATMSRRNKQKDMNFLESLVRKNQVSLIVVGYPLNMDGSEGFQAQKIRDAARQIEQNVNVPVRLWDERLTSLQAHRALREAGMIAGRQTEHVDRMAAVLLLQNFLDAQANQQRRVDRADAESPS